MTRRRKPATNRFPETGRLPSDWADAKKWARLRDGYRKQIQIDASSESWTSLVTRLKEFIEEKSIKKDSKGKTPTRRNRKSIEDKITNYFQGDDDLELDEVAVILDHLDVRPQVHRSPQFDIFRYEWTQGTGDDEKDRRLPHSVRIWEFGKRLWRVQPMTCERVINGVVQSWFEPEWGPLEKNRTKRKKNTPLPQFEYHVSRGAGFMVVLEGAVEFKYLGPGKPTPIRLEKNQCLFYRQSWPHDIQPVSGKEGENARTLEICSSKRSLPIEYLLRGYEAPDLIEWFEDWTQLEDGSFDPGYEKPGLDAPVHLLSHALASCVTEIDHLAEVLHMRGPKKEGKVENITKEMVAGVREHLRLPDVAEIGHALRTPERHFFTPLQEHLTQIVKGPINLIDDDDSDDHTWQVDRNGVRERFLGFPPTEILGRMSELSVNLVQCSTLLSDVEQFDQPSLTPVHGERMIVCIQGKLGIQLKEGPDGGATCDGELNTNDTLWLRADEIPLAIWNLNPSGEPTILLDFRYPFAGERDVSWGWEASLNETPATGESVVTLDPAARVDSTERGGRSITRVQHPRVPSDRHDQ